MSTTEAKTIQELLKQHRVEVWDAYQSASGTITIKEVFEDADLNFVAQLNELMLQVIGEDVHWGMFEKSAFSISGRNPDQHEQSIHEEHERQRQRLSALLGESDKVEDKT